MTKMLNMVSAHFGAVCKWISLANQIQELIVSCSTADKVLDKELKRRDKMLTQALAQQEESYKAIFLDYQERIEKYQKVI